MLFRSLPYLCVFYGCIFTWRYLQHFVYLFFFPLDVLAMSVRRFEDSRCYTIFDGVLYHQGIDGVLLRAINAEEASMVVKQYHDGFCGGHYETDYTTKKILHAGYYWPTLFKDVTLHCKTCEFC